MNDTARTLDDFVKAGVNLSALGAQLQEEGATSFVKSWNDLLNVISSKTASLQQAA
jgi:transaldolase